MAFDEFWESEYRRQALMEEKFQRERLRRMTREERKYRRARLFYAAAIIVWLVVMAVILMTGTPKHAEAPVDPVVEEEHLNSIIEAADDVVEPADDGIDLTKFNGIENARVTAYCICRICCGKDVDHPEYGITASGRPAEPNVSVAVDPSVIPLGSMVYVDYGDGVLLEYRADDTGSGVNMAHVDICMETHDMAEQHGVQRATVYWKEE